MLPNKPNEGEATSWQIEAEPWPYPTLKKPHHVLRCSREGTRMMAKAGDPGVMGREACVLPAARSACPAVAPLPRMPRIP